MFRLYFLGQDVPNYVVDCTPQRLVKFGCLFTIIYKKRNNYHVNGFFGRSVINVSGGGCQGSFHMAFRPTTYVKQVI